MTLTISAAAAIVAEHYFDRTGSGPSEADLEQLAARAAARRRQYEADPEFPKAMARLATAGIPYEFGGQSDPCGSFSTLRLRGNANSKTCYQTLSSRSENRVILNQGIVFCFHLNRQ
jgi:hypothetical protein